jgi:hypothetical protein
LIAELKTGGLEAARTAFHRDPVRSFTALTEGSELAGILPFVLSVSPEISNASTAFPSTDAVAIDGSPYKPPYRNLVGSV